MFRANDLIFTVYYALRELNKIPKWIWIKITISCTLCHFSCVIIQYTIYISSKENKDVNIESLKDESKQKEMFSPFIHDFYFVLL